MVKMVTAPDLNGDLHKVAIEDLRWRSSAYAIVIKDDKVLTSPQVNGYDLPVGGIELGEMPGDAVVREVWEETGICVGNPQIVAVTSNYFVLPVSKRGTKIQSLLLYYVCDFISGELDDSGFTEDEKVFSKFPEWVSLKEITTAKLGTVYDWRPLAAKVAMR